MATLCTFKRCHGHSRQVAAAVLTDHVSTCTSFSTLLQAEILHRPIGASFSMRSTYAATPTAQCALCIRQ
eukprot:6182636-Pleurochrysis_carterae.AAC.2